MCIRFIPVVNWWQSASPWHEALGSEGYWLRRSKQGSAGSRGGRPLPWALILFPREGSVQGLGTPSAWGAARSWRRDLNPSEPLTAVQGCFNYPIEHLPPPLTMLNDPNGSFIILMLLIVLKNQRPKFRTNWISSHLPAATCIFQRLKFKHSSSKNYFSWKKWGPSCFLLFSSCSFVLWPVLNPLWHVAQFIHC